MSFTVRISKNADADLRRIFAQLAAKDIGAAKRARATIFKSMELLKAPVRNIRKDHLVRTDHQAINGLDRLAGFTLVSDFWTVGLYGDRLAFRYFAVDDFIFEVMNRVSHVSNLRRYFVRNECWYLSGAWPNPSAPANRWQ